MKGDLNKVVEGNYCVGCGACAYASKGVMKINKYGEYEPDLNSDVFKNKEEQKIYSSIYKYEHTRLVPGYQSIAKYHKDIDAVVIQFTNTVNFEGYNWNLSEVMYGRVIKILKRNN